MPNAWFYYVLPLFISTVSLASGLFMLRQSLRGATDAKGNKYGSGAGCAGVLFALVGGTIGLAILFASPTPWARQKIFQHVFHTPAQRIERFVLKGGRNSRYDLTPADVVIDDPTQIRKIAQLLDAAAAHEVSPNHPTTRWTAEVEMVTLDGTYYFTVTATPSGDRNGTLLSASAKPPGGWNLGHVRADGLETILQDAVKAKSPTTQH